MSNLIKTGRILLVSSQTSHRSGLRKTLCDMGADNKNIEIAADFNQAKEKLSHGPVNIIITDDEIGTKEGGIELIQIHEKNNPSTRNRVFILMTSQSTPFLMSTFILRGGDIIISKPFKNETVIRAISNIIAEKDNVSISEGILWDIQDAVKENNMELALKLITTFKDHSSVEATYSKAVIHEANQELSEAYDMYSKVLEKKVNFKSLVSLLKIGTSTKKYSEVLKFVEIWIKDFPIHHESIPDITRVIIANKKFQLLDELFQLFSQHKISDRFAQVPLAAGFIMASKNHLEHNQLDESKSYALKGIEYSCNRFQILSRALEILMKLGDQNEAKNAYLKFNQESTKTEDRIFDLRLKSIVYSSGEILGDCQKLLSEKVIDPDLYQITINCLKEIGKNPEEIVALAKKNFPEREFIL